jgi:uncharacterized cysteine cluster protein YcgN (CxxCxxCC family)
VQAIVEVDWLESSADKSADFAKRRVDQTRSVHICVQTIVEIGWMLENCAAKSAVFAKRGDETRSAQDQTRSEMAAAHFNN